MDSTFLGLFLAVSLNCILTRLSIRIDFHFHQILQDSRVLIAFFSQAILLGFLSLLCRFFSLLLTMSQLSGAIEPRWLNQVAADLHNEVNELEISRVRLPFDTDIWKSTLGFIQSDLVCFIIINENTIDYNHLCRVEKCSLLRTWVILSAFVTACVFTLVPLFVFHFIDGMIRAVALIDRNLKQELCWVDGVPHFGSFICSIATLLSGVWPR